MTGWPGKRDYVRVCVCLCAFARAVDQRMTSIDGGMDILTICLAASWVGY